jgi:hypothetical protein
MTGRRATRLVATILALAALALTVASCGGDGGGASDAVAPVDRTWTKVALGGDCECADGSKFAVWERRADPSKVVFRLTAGA